MSQNIGKVVEIIGPVVDIQFSQNNLPDLLTAIEIERPNEENLIVEVEQDIGADRVRCIAMGSTDGLVRGMDAIDTKNQFRLLSEKMYWVVCLMFWVNQLMV